MSGASDYLENELLDHVMGCGTRNYTSPTNIFVGFSTTTPADDASGITEPTGGAYARVSTDQTDWNIAAANAVTNAAAITFVQATASWGDVVAVLLYDAVSGGNFLGFASIDATEVRSGDQPVFEIGELSISLTAFSNYLNLELLDHVFGCGTRDFAPAADIYVGMSAANPGGDGSGLAEPSGGSYARVQSDESDWAASSGGIVVNSGALTFPQAGAAWGTMTYLAAFDASTAGNMLIYGALSSSRVVALGDIVAYAVGQVSVFLD